MSILKLEGMFVSFKENIGEVSAIFPLNKFDFNKNKNSIQIFYGAIKLLKLNKDYI